MEHQRAGLKANLGRQKYLTYSDEVWFFLIVQQCTEIYLSCYISNQIDPVILIKKTYK